MRLKAVLARTSGYKALRSYMPQGFNAEMKIIVQSLYGQHKMCTDGTGQNE